MRSALSGLWSVTHICPATPHNSQITERFLVFPLCQVRNLRWENPSPCSLWPHKEAVGPERGPGHRSWRRLALNPPPATLHPCVFGTSIPFLQKGKQAQCRAAWLTVPPWQVAELGSEPVAVAGKDLICIRAELGRGERQAGRRSPLTRTRSQPAVETVQGCPGAAPVLRPSRRRRVYLGAFSCRRAGKKTREWPGGRERYLPRGHHVSSIPLPSHFILPASHAVVLCSLQMGKLSLRQVPGSSPLHRVSFLG